MISNVASGVSAIFVGVLVVVVAVLNAEAHFFDGEYLLPEGYVGLIGTPREVAADHPAARKAIGAAKAILRPQPRQPKDTSDEDTGNTPAKVEITPLMLRLQDGHLLSRSTAEGYEPIVFGAEMTLAVEDDDGEEEEASRRRQCARISFFFDHRGNTMLIGKALVKRPCEEEEETTTSSTVKTKAMQVLSYNIWNYNEPWE
jgi:hypothetical protein